MSVHSEDLMPAAAGIHSNRQRLFLLYFVGALVDLVVLGLFDQYSDKVFVDDFTTMLMASIVLQLLLKATIAVEHKVAAYFNSKSGGFNRFLRFFCAGRPEEELGEPAVNPNHDLFGNHHRHNDDD